MIFVRYASPTSFSLDRIMMAFLAFTENVVIIANPSKSGGDWWYGKNVSTGKSGLFPQTYIEIIQPCKSPFHASYALFNVSSNYSYDLLCFYSP